MSTKFEIGDLVTAGGFTWPFHGIGLVLETKIAKAFEPEEKIYDVRVLWQNGHAFWCLDFILKHFYKK